MVSDRVYEQATVMIQTLEPLLRTPGVGVTDTNGLHVFVVWRMNVICHFFNHTNQFGTDVNIKLDVWREDVEYHYFNDVSEALVIVKEFFHV